MICLIERTGQVKIFSEAGPEEGLDRLCKKM